MNDDDTDTITAPAGTDTPATDAPATGTSTAELDPEITFESLGVSADLITALQAQGIKEPFAIQRLSIADALAGRDVCGKAKTGSGKTLAFGIPLLQRITTAQPRKPKGLVLVPTRELALQVHDVLAPLAKGIGARVVAVYGGADMNKQIKALSDGVETIIATPGRLIDLVERKEVELNGLEIVVVDEADRMADMGFLPQVEWLLRHVDTQHQTLLFSATLDGVVDGLIKRYQHDPVYWEVQSTTVTVDAMVHRFLAVHEMDKVKVAATIARSSGRVLAFTNTKRVADRLASALNEEGVRAAAIHGDLRQGQREDALRDFTSGKLQVMVATDVAARGLHIDDIDVVIHYEPAPDHKTYLHRSGRTARAGSKGLAVSLSIWNEELHMKRLQKRIGVIQPLTEMFSNDERLQDLTAWDPGTA